MPILLSAALTVAVLLPLLMVKLVPPPDTTSLLALPTVMAPLVLVRVRVPDPLKLMSPFKVMVPESVVKLPPLQVMGPEMTNEPSVLAACAKS